MPKILLVNNAEPGIHDFTKPLEKIATRYGNAVIIEYKDCASICKKNFDGIILSGSPQGDDIVEHHLPYYKWLEETEKPVLGICAGHHITGYLFGAKLLRKQEPESGDFFVTIVAKDPVLHEIANPFRVKQMHNDSITLPNNFGLLGTSKVCRNQLMKHKQKPIYTCQFHPEFYNHRLIQNFIKLCTNKKEK